MSETRKNNDSLIEALYLEELSSPDNTPSYAHNVTQESLSEFSHMIDTKEVSFDIVASGRRELAEILAASDHPRKEEFVAVLEKLAKDSEDLAEAERNGDTQKMAEIFKSPEHLEALKMLYEDEELSRISRDYVHSLFKAHVQRIDPTFTDEEFAKVKASVDQSIAEEMPGIIARINADLAAAKAANSTGKTTEELAAIQQAGLALGAAVSGVASYNFDGEFEKSVGGNNKEQETEEITR